MKVKKNLRRAKNPPSQESSEFPIVPVMAMFLVFAGLGVFVYWDRKRRTMPQNRPQLTSNFTPQQYRSQLQMPAFQASNLDPDGVPTWMNRDTTNPQIDRWLNDPSYWNSESSGGSGSSGQQTNQTQTNQTQTTNTDTGPGTGFYAVFYIDPGVNFGETVKNRIKDRLSGMNGFDLSYTNRVESVQVQRDNPVQTQNQIKNLLGNPNKKMLFIIITDSGIDLNLIGNNGRILASGGDLWGNPDERMAAVISSLASIESQLN